MHLLVPKGDIMIKLTLKIPIYPTETVNNLQHIFEHFNPTEDFKSSITETEDDGVKILSMTLHGLESVAFLFRQTRRQRVVEAVRRYALERMDLNHHQCILLLHKQALFQKRIAVCGDSTESPLGAVQVIIDSHDIERLMEYLFPHTEMGKVLEVDYIPE